MTDFFLKMKIHRMQRNLRQSDIAKQLNLTTTYYSQLERGEVKNPSETLIKRISDVFDFDFVELILFYNKLPKALIDNLKSDIAVTKSVIEHFKIKSLENKGND